MAFAYIVTILLLACHLPGVESANVTNEIIPRSNVLPASDTGLRVIPRETDDKFLYAYWMFSSKNIHIDIHLKSDLTQPPFKLTHPEPSKGAKWGSSISSNNKYVVIGAEDLTYNNAKKQGGAFIYDISKATSTDISSNLVETISAGSANKYFGFMVAINKDNLIFASDKYIKFMYVFKQEPNKKWKKIQTIPSVLAPNVFDNLVAIVSNSPVNIQLHTVNKDGMSKKSVHDFPYGESTRPTQEQYAFRQDLMVIGEPITGKKVSIYTKEDGKWNLSQTIPNDNEFGKNVRMVGDVFVASAKTFTGSADYSGRVYVYVKGEDGQFEEKMTLELEKPKGYEQFGEYCQIDETNVYVANKMKQLYFFKHGLDTTPKKGASKGGNGSGGMSKKTIIIIVVVVVVVVLIVVLLAVCYCYRRPIGLRLMLLRASMGYGSPVEQNIAAAI